MELVQHHVLPVYHILKSLTCPADNCEQRLREITFTQEIKEDN